MDGTREALLFGVGNWLDELVPTAFPEEPLVVCGCRLPLAQPPNEEGAGRPPLPAPLVLLLESNVGKEEPPRPPMTGNEGV